jgi:hypothetical protein
MDFTKLGATPAQLRRAADKLLALATRVPDIRKAQLLKNRAAELRVRAEKMSPPATHDNPD